MTPLDLEIQNFMGIGYAKLNLRERGLNLIQGENRDDTSAKSNGSGKSSLPDALCWCCFDETARGESGDAIVNSTAGKDCAVTYRVEDDDGTVYAISRHRKHSVGGNKARVLNETTGRDLTLGTDKLTQPVINQILGCNLDVFKAAIYAGQEQMPNLPKMTDKPLKELVEEASGVNILQACHAEAKKRASLIEGNLAGHTNQLKHAQDTLERTEKRIDETKAQSHGWLLKQKARLAEIEDRIGQAKITKESGEGAYKVLLASRESLLAEVKELKDSLGQRGEHEKIVKGLNQQIVAIEKKIAASNARLQMETRQAQKLKADLENVSSRVGKPCGECGKPLEVGDLSHAIAACKTSLRDSVSKLRTEKDGRQKLDAERLEAQSKLSDASAKLTDVSSVIARMDSLNDEVGSVSEQIDEYEGLDAAMDDLVNEAARVYAELDPFAPLLRSALNEKAEVEARIEELKKQIEEIGVSLELAEAAVDVFAPAGVRAHILDHVTPFLNTRTAHYLSHLSDGNLTAIWSTLSSTKKGDLREKFNIEVKAATGSDRFGLLSGGEKRKVRLACAMALQDLVAQRATKSIRLFMADEIDDALDDAGMERLMDLLNERAAACGTVLVISHNELSDWIRDQTFVIRESGKATVTGALAA